MGIDEDEHPDSPPVLERSYLCSHHLFERQAARSPTAVAAVFEGKLLTYRELDRLANRLANHLRTLGVGPDKLVGLCVERSLEMVIGILGILKAGGAFVPIDPAYPRARIGQILRASRAEVLVTRRSLSAELPEHQAREVHIDERAGAGDALNASDAGDAGDASDAGDADPAVAMRAEHLGYVIFTSGSTGEPKGVCLPHAALVNLILWHDRTLLRGARTLQFASLSFDASFHEMFAAWCSGGTVFLITEATRHDVAALIRFIERERIEKVILPVVVVQQMAEIAGDEPHRFQSLRELTTTGEQLHITAPVIRLFKQLPRCAFHNHYGPSETHVVTAYTMPGDPSTWEAHPPIGWPIDATEILVLDDHGRPAAVGEVGELYIGGVMLARGYLHRPDLTAERFLPNPLRNEPGARLYWTGDLARVREDGCIEFLGRSDHQVKIRGFRIELGEIEATLDRFPGVKSTAVLAREDSPGDKRLVAYVVADADATQPERARSLIAELRAHARDRLPDYMVPSAFVLLERMPLTQNGKVDRRALPAPDRSRPAIGQAFVVPRPGVEERLAAIWEEVLRLGPVGARDDFFELGGHSIHAVQVASRVRRAFGVEVAFQQIFEGPTVAELAAVIEKAQRSPSDRIGQIDRRLPLPLSFAQERLWFLQRLAPDSTAYSCPYFFRLTGRLDVPALERALGEIVRRHEVLRMWIAETRLGVAARIASGDALRLDVTDLQALSSEERREEARSILDAVAARPFDLTRERPFRAGLIKLGETEHALWMNIHHIVTDGRSMEVLFGELSALYKAFSANDPSPLGEPIIQFADYAAWQRERIGARALADLVTWWKGYLDGAPTLLDLPTDHPRPRVQSFRGRSIPFRVDRPLSSALREVAARRKMTLTMVVLAAFAVELHRYTGRDDILIGVPTLGRDRVDLEEVVGFFVNTLPIRIHFGGDPSMNEVLERVRTASLLAYEHDGLPFHQLVQELHPERALSHNPLVQVGFAPQPPGERDLRLDGLEVRPLDVNAKKTTFDLTVFLWEGEGGIDGALELSDDLFEQPTMERFARHLLAILGGVAADPTRRVSTLPLAGEAERRAILSEWSATPASPPKFAIIPELVETQATLDPSAEAIVFGEKSLPYGELNRRSNQVARALQKRGVGPETRVGLCVERSLEMVVGLLGILKAGGAYVPLDPTYPLDRLAFMVEDSALSVLVTRSSELDRLPSFSGSILKLDDRSIAAESDAPFPRAAGPNNAAYAIYTSGSTGRPKGVVVEHRSAMHLAAALQQKLQLTPEARVLQLSSLGFDASVFDILLAWVSGATLVLAPPRLLPGPDLSRVLHEHRISVLALSPSALAQQPFEAFPHLTTLVVGGEVCPAALVDRWAPGRRFINGYGPTEATVGATLTACEPGRGTPPIGRPIGGTRAYILDARGQVVPPGVVGELFIGGPGVARGYLNRPALTSDRFGPDPLSGEPGARMYRTGDVARWRSDGRIEFMGRIDQQVKIRGFRVELGEIEEALREHPAVREVAVLARNDARMGTQLVAYVVEEGADEPLESELIAERRIFYNTNTYKRSAAAGLDPTFDIAGWNSSFTGEPISADAMRAWRDHAVRRILDRRPERVWDIGCGTGLLLFQVAPRCAEYFGTDLSEAIIERLRPIVAARGLSQVALERREAIDFREGDRGRFDLVVLNSTVQYFPDARYLRGVLEGAASAVQTGGSILIGDVRSLPLLEAFHTAVELGRAPEGTSVELLRDRVQAALASESELVIAPDFFRALCSEDARFVHAEILLKRGRGSDEMTRFRYDVWLFVGEAPEPVHVSASRSFHEFGGDLASVERWLSAEPIGTVEVVGIPNDRVEADRAAWDRLERGLDATSDALVGAARKVRGIDPEDVWELGERLGYSVRLTFSTSDPGLVDALFERSPEAAALRPWKRPISLGGVSARLVNDPLAKRRSPRIAPALRAYLRGRLPDFMIPSAFVAIPKLPLTPNGKVDRRALPAPARRKPSPGPAGGAPGSPIEQALAEIWREVLDLDRVGLDEGFFDLGGHSLLLTRVRAAIADRLGREVPMTDLFRHPTIRRLASHLDALAEDRKGARLNETDISPAAAITTKAPSGAIAIIGMAGRFPGASNVGELWENLRVGVESITFSTPEELEAAGVDPALIRSPSFVPAMGIVRESVAFDAAFFGYSPNEARLMDPQHRLFLELAHTALESAGYAMPITRGRVGVFGGTDAPRYWLERLGALSAPLSAEEYQVGLGNIADTLTTRVAYKLGLRGPALTVMSACSTSLVAVHLAARSLLGRECDMALAGASVVLPPDRLGHLVEDGSIASPDGHCRPFDAGAQGTVGASGAALVVLKRLEDALADGDSIHAVIRGSAINNDGPMKVGFMAPGLDGQADVIARAQEIAGVSPEDISFVEAHGTATRLGDPVEVAALTQAFRRRTDKRGFCTLGSLKSNVGHMGATAGVGGLIKATLALTHEMIPPTVHFRSPNPECNLAESPFFVNAEPLAWKRGAIPRRAGVSSFGVGGTNAHLILEEAPALEPTRSVRSHQILPLSARTAAALDASSDNLCARIEGDPELCLADAAFTLQTGRTSFKYRRAVVARDRSSAATALRARDPSFVFEGIARAQAPKVVFMFPGGGTQEVGMGRALYEAEPVYREALDACAALFEAELDVDFRSALFANDADPTDPAERLRHPTQNLASIFATEFALAKLLMAWGITPSALIGHSLGEYTAACIGGVLSLEDAIALVALRGRLYADLPGNAATLLLPLSEASIAPRLREGVSLAAVNGPENCVVSGVADAIRGFEAELLREGIEVRRFGLTTATHSPLLKNAAERLTERAESMNLRQSRIPLVSNVTGHWLSDTESRDPSHWARHLCSPVRFADGIATLLADPDHVFVEVGPGRTLASLTARQPGSGGARLITTSMAATGSLRTDLEATLCAVARLWCAGVPIDFEALRQGERRRRIPLPTYPFERTPYMIEASARSRTSSWSVAAWPGHSTPTPAPRSGRPSIPMSSLEQALAGIWRELLGVEALRPEDNFFDLGGDSLLAVRLRAKLRERFEVPIALHDLIESPTLGALAKRIEKEMPDPTFNGEPPVSSARVIGPPRQGASPQARLCVRLEKGDPRIRPLFLVQPLGGTVFTYLSLARALGGGIPVYGVRASGLEEGEPILDDVPAMAARYLEELRLIQPEGPFVIGGHSAGGVIAFEMARKLEAEGEDPGLILMLDTPGLPKHVKTREALLREFESFRDIAPHAYRGLAAALRDDAALSSVMLAMSEALARYEARPLGADIAYIRARDDRDPSDLHAEQAWMDRAKGAFTLHNVLGNHFTMMDPPHVATVARVVSLHLAALGHARLEAPAVAG